MQIFTFTLIAVLIVALDQFTKWLTVVNIPLYSGVDFIPGFLSFTNVRNTGAAFSALEGQIWLFVLFFIVFTALIVWEVVKKPIGFSGFERICLAAVYGGGLGNMIDRIRLGYVVDMIKTEFISFPVFNVADCFITCGCIALMISLLFFHQEIWGSDKKKE